jgi:hypothetical protein
VAGSTGVALYRCLLMASRAEVFCQVCEPVESEVMPGPHRVQVASGEDHSKEVRVTLEPGEGVRMAVSVRRGEAWFNPLFWGNAVHLGLRETKRAAT